MTSKPYMKWLMNWGFTCKYPNKQLKQSAFVFSIFMFCFIYACAKEAMHIIRGRLLWSAKFRCQITVQTLMIVMVPHRKRYHFFCHNVTLNLYRNIEDLCCSQIRMSTETAERVGSLLHSSQAEGSKHTSGNVSSVASGSGQGNKQTPVSEMTTKPSSRLELDTVKEKEKLSLQLKESQEKMKVHIRILKFDIRCYCFDVVKLNFLFFFYLFLMSFCWEMCSC